MIILGIESSCDDTSACLLQCEDHNRTVLRETTASQIEIHKQYGGVVPEIAGRKHAEHIIPVIDAVMHGQAKPDAIAVTTGPGLMTGLLVGTEVAKTLSYLWDVPIIPINHIEGHIYSVLLETQEAAISFPAVYLITSGGHTEFILMTDHGTYEKIGGTRDDAVGEAFDKVAKMLSLAYPGGPKISALAETGNPKAIAFPRPMLQDETLDMSFSGLKTSALYWLRDHELDTPDGPSTADFCASFQTAIIEVLLGKMKKAISKYAPQSIILAGGVSANTALRAALEGLAIEKDINFLKPQKKYSMDNAAMIAMAGYYHAMRQDYTPLEEVAANPVWRIYPTTSE